MGICMGPDNLRFAVYLCNKSNAAVLTTKTLWFSQYNFRIKEAKTLFLGNGYLSRRMTKQTKWLRPAKPQISLGIRPVWSESSLSAWGKIGSLTTQWAHSKDSDQTGWISRLTWVFARRTCHFVDFVIRRLIWGYTQEVQWIEIYSKSLSLKTQTLKLDRTDTQLHFATGMFRRAYPWSNVLNI